MKHLQAITSASETDSLFICIYMGGTPGHMQVNLCMQGHRSEIFASNNISFWSPSLKIESGFWAPISLGTDKSEGQQKVLNSFHTCPPPFHNLLRNPDASCTFHPSFPIWYFHYIESSHFSKPWLVSYLLSKQQHDFDSCCLLYFLCQISLSYYITDYTIALYNQ